MSRSGPQVITDPTRHLERLAAAFAPMPLTVQDEPRHGNRVVFGFVAGGSAGPSALSRAGQRQPREAFVRLRAALPAAGFGLAQ